MRNSPSALYGYVEEWLTRQHNVVGGPDGVEAGCLGLLSDEPHCGRIVHADGRERYAELGSYGYGRESHWRMATPWPVHDIGDDTSQPDPSLLNLPCPNSDNSPLRRCLPHPYMVHTPRS